MHKCGAPDTPEAFVSVSRTSSWRQQLERAAGPTRSTHACASAAGSAGSVGQIERAARRRAARTPPGELRELTVRHSKECARSDAMHRSESARSCRGAAQTWSRLRAMQEKLVSLTPVARSAPLQLAARGSCGSSCATCDIDIARAAKERNALHVGRCFAAQGARASRPVRVKRRARAHGGSGRPAHQG